MFAKLLPDAERVPPTRQERARSPERADSARTGVRAEERQANKSESRQASNSRESQASTALPSKTSSAKDSPAKSAQERNPAESEDIAAESVGTEAENTPTADTGTMVAGLTTTATSPVDPTLAADTPSPANGVAAEAPLPESDTDAAKPASGAPGSALPTAPQAAAAATASPAKPAPLVDPIVENPLIGSSETGKPAPQVQTGATAEPDLPAGDTPPSNVPAAKTATATHTETPLLDVRSGQPAGDTPEAPAPAVDSSEPGNPANNIPKLAKPAPETPELGKPQVAADAQAGKPADAIDANGKPPAPPDDALQELPRDSLVRLSKVEPQTGNAADDTSAEPADAETTKPLVSEAEAKGGKSVPDGEAAEPGDEAKPARAPKPHGHAEFRSVIVDPANIEFRATDVRTAQPIDLTTALIPSTHPTHTIAPATPTAAQAALTPPVPIEGLAVAIATNAKNGNSRFEIRLDPPELGRIDVRLHIDSRGHVTSHLIVDRAETLDLLRRDAADLERSLQQSGLKMSDNGMQFSLRDQSPNANRNDDGQALAAYVVVPDTEPAADIAMRGYTRAGEGAGLDIRV